MNVVSADRPKEPLIGLRAAAEFLGMSPLTVRRMVYASRLPAIAFPHVDGKHTYRFRLSELESFVNSLRRPVGAKTV